jgi:ribosomal-protein-alanine N-acetyltransferase
VTPADRADGGIEAGGGVGDPVARPGAGPGSGADPGPVLLVRPLLPDDAAAIASWRYAPPFDLYDSTSADDLAGPDANGHGYYALTSPDGELVGFCCLGPEGRVPGQDDEPATLDLGLGIRPDLVSRGLAGRALPAVLALAQQVGGSPLRLRTAVAAFNERSLRLCRRAGLVEQRRFVGPGGREFVELVREV